MTDFGYNDSSALLEIPRRLAREAQANKPQLQMPEIPNELVVKCHIWHPDNMCGKIILTFSGGFVLSFDLADNAELISDRTPPDGPICVHYSPHRTYSCSCDCARGEQ